MFDLAALQTFAAVVRCGNFTAAAHELHLPRSTVSQRVARLEEHLGVRLLERSTRAVRPTSAGLTYFERCSTILGDIEQANAAASLSTTTSQGLLRVACPILFGHTFLPGILASFAREHGEVEVEVAVTERRVNLIEEGFDVAIRIVDAEESSAYVTRKLGGGRMWCVASPGYIARHGKPRTPEALASHRCIVHGDSRTTSWRFQRGEEVRRIAIHGWMAVSSLLIMHAVARDGGGLTRVPEALCAEDVRAGRLVRVLPEWRDELDLRILYPSNRHLSPRVRHFVDAVVSESRRRLAPAPATR